MQKETKNKKPKWGKPRLVVVGLGGSGEGVLAKCKNDGGNQVSGPHGDGSGRCCEWPNYLCSNTTGTTS